MYLLSCNVGEIVLLAGAVIAGLPLPLTAVQILYVNLATDGLPALALAVDPPERISCGGAARPARRHLHPAGRGHPPGGRALVRRW
jgi:magnesium-transporting ATPase (P-type)